MWLWKSAFYIKTHKAYSWHTVCRIWLLVTIITDSCIICLFWISYRKLKLLPIFDCQYLPCMKNNVEYLKYSYCCLLYFVVIFLWKFVFKYYFLLKILLASIYCKWLWFSLRHFHPNISCTLCADKPLYPSFTTCFPDIFTSTLMSHLYKWLYIII